MFEAIIEENAIRLRIGSELHLVNEAVRACTRFASALTVDEPIALSLLLRELLVNAVKHGNRCDPGRQVTVEVVREADDELRVQVTDEGTGFNYKALHLGLPIDASHVRRHGYMLIAALSERIVFNTQGNSVTTWIKTGRWALSATFLPTFRKEDSMHFRREIVDEIARLVRCPLPCTGRPCSSNSSMAHDKC